MTLIAAEADVIGSGGSLLQLDCNDHIEPTEVITCQ